MNLWSENEILARGCSFGFAIDCMKQGRRITREVWGGWWQVETISTITKPVIVAYLKDGKTKSVATPYQEDILAKDWIVLTDKTEGIPKTLFVFDIGKTIKRSEFTKEKEKDDYSEIFKYIKLSDAGVELMDTFRSKFERRKIEPGVTRHILDQEYQDLMNTIQCELNGNAEEQVLKRIVDLMYNEFFRQIN